MPVVVHKVFSLSHIEVSHENVAAVHWLDPADHVQQGGFAAAGRPGEHRKFLVCNLHGQVIKDHMTANRFFHMVYLNHNAPPLRILDSCCVSSFRIIR